MKAMPGTCLEVWAGSGEAAQRIAVALSVANAAVPAACLIPDLPGARDIGDLTDALLEAEIGDVLTAVLVEVQRVLPRLRRDGGGLVFLLPHEPAMGRPHDTAASAVAGGILTMARTLAIELRRDGVTVNTVLFAVLMETAVVRQVEALLAPDSAAVTGQEIYVTAGTDLGRLRP